MSAQPITDNDPHDPQVILRELPEREHKRFLQEYRLAARLAAEDPAKYHDLQTLLRAWSTRAIAVNTPGYYEAIEEAKSGVGGTHPFEESLAAALARRS